MSRSVPVLFLKAAAGLCLLAAVAITPVSAQTAPGADSGQAPVTPPVLRLPPVTVVARKEPAPLERVAGSVTAVQADRIDGSGLQVVSDLAVFAPNTFYSDLSARKVSNARFRGIGSSPANPAVTTFIDGVPQLNANTANIDLLDVEQIEFVRGAQSALFGRNTLGGVVNVTSRRPSLSAWTGRAVVPVGSDAERGVQAGVAGPLVRDRVGASFAMGYSRRDGFTENTLTGNQIDGRSAFAAKGQLFFASRGPWQANVTISGERDRDGDYTLGDLASIRRDPYRVSRDYEGRTDRDVFATTVAIRRAGSRVALTSTTGIVDWKTFDETDLDYTPFPAVIRSNTEDARQFSQELRLASTPAAPVRLSESATVAWQAGVFAFTQDYAQDAVNRFSPFVLSPQVPFAVDNHSPLAALNDVGVGLFGQATITWRERLDVSAGLRVDHERKDATLRSFFEPAIFPGGTVEAERRDSAVSPQVAVAFRPREGHLMYASVGRGFKAGGFNPASPQGNEAYGEERAWHVEGGVKASAIDGRVAVTGSVFVIDWTAMQLNLPNPFVPGQFYIANVGGATSRGAELAVEARAHQHLDVFGSVGLTRARFQQGSVSSGVDVSGNTLPSTPGYTAVLGAEFARPVNASLAVYTRGEVVAYGSFHYDDVNTASQDAYALTNMRAGVRSERVFLEGWIRNAFDTRYVPVAFAYDPNSAPSGFLGEPGRPRTFGLRVGVSF